MRNEAVPIRGPRAVSSATVALLSILCMSILLLGLVQGAAAQKTEIEELDVEKLATAPDQTGHFSLLDDGHEDKVFFVRTPDIFSIYTRYFLVLADGNFLVPVDRLENESMSYFVFHRSIHGDCLHSDVKFFRKIVEGKVAGFYAIQWNSSMGDDLPDDVDGFDDFRNSIIVYELFRFVRGGREPPRNYSQFRKVAEKRVVVQSCGEAENYKDVIEMIRNY